MILRPVSGRALKRKKFREPSQPKRASRREPRGGEIPMRVKAYSEDDVNFDKTIDTKAIKNFLEAIG